MRPRPTRRAALLLLAALAAAGGPVGVAGAPKEHLIEVGKTDYDVGLAWAAVACLVLVAGKQEKESALVVLFVCVCVCAWRQDRPRSD